MNFFKSRRILRETNSLDLIPVRICGHGEEAGRIVIFVPKFRSPVTHIFFPKTRMLFFRIKLDANGSSIWKNIDGKRNISEISDTIREVNSSEEVEERTTKFMNMLYERRCITFQQLSDEPENLTNPLS